MNRSLLGHLLAWTLGALVLVWGMFIAVGWQTGQHEADELTDGHLASAATLLLAHDLGGRAVPAVASAAPAGGLTLKAHDYQQSLSVAVWDPQGHVVTRSGDAPEPPFTAREGFDTLKLGAPAVEWRAFTRWNEPHTRKVTVLLSAHERDELADDIAWQIIEPGLWVLPVIMLVLVLAIRRGLRPLYELSNEVHALEVEEPHALAAVPRHEEFGAIANAINTLAARFHSAIDRERALASELAHELRTPLAALGLQARAARGLAPGPARDAALARVEAEALRAGEVLSHLLALARAERTASSEPAQAVDLTQLAREVLAEHASTAARTGHELALAASEPFEVEGHAVLLQLALRNLVENALAHTPPGSLVEVQVDPRARWLQVCDTGAPEVTHAAADEAPGDPGPGLGLGLGHQVVGKIAGVHGARLETVAPPPGFRTAYRLQFDAGP